MKFVFGAVVALFLSALGTQDAQAGKADIRCVQDMLRLVGYNIKVDGDFGPKTRKTSSLYLNASHWQKTGGREKLPPLSAENAARWCAAMRAAHPEVLPVKVKDSTFEKVDDLWYVKVRGGMDMYVYNMRPDQQPRHIVLMIHGDGATRKDIKRWCRSQVQQLRAVPADLNELMFVCLFRVDSAIGHKRRTHSEVRKVSKSVRQIRKLYEDVPLSCFGHSGGGHSCVAASQQKGISFQCAVAASATLSVVRRGYVQFGNKVNTKHGYDPVLYVRKTKADKLVLVGDPTGNDKIVHKVAWEHFYKKAREAKLPIMYLRRGGWGHETESAGMVQMMKCIDGLSAQVVPGPSPIHTPAPAPVPAPIADILCVQEVLKQVGFDVKVDGLLGADTQKTAKMYLDNSRDLKTGVQEELSALTPENASRWCTAMQVTHATVPPVTVKGMAFYKVDDFWYAKAKGSMEMYVYNMQPDQQPKHIVLMIHGGGATQLNTKSWCRARVQLLQPAPVDLEGFMFVCPIPVDPSSGYKQRTHEQVRRISQSVRQIKEVYPNVPVSCYGHAGGGYSCVAAAQQKNVFFECVVTASPTLAGVGSDSGRIGERLGEHHTYDPVLHVQQTKAKNFIIVGDPSGKDLMVQKDSWERFYNKARKTTLPVFYVRVPGWGHETEPLGMIEMMRCTKAYVGQKKLKPM